MTTFPMLQKELRELVRSYKILFVPVLFAFFALSQPVSIKLLPTLLESSTNLPPGAVIDIPTPAAPEIIATMISQLNMMGMLVLILVSMGAIAGERSSGVAAMVLVKPVGRGRYFLAKVISYTVLVALSLLFGMAMATYYTEVLFGEVAWGAVFAGVLAYMPNLLLAVAVTLCGSSFLRSPVAAGGFGLVVTVILMNVPAYMGEFVRSLSPGELTEQAVCLIQGQACGPSTPLIGVSALIAVFLIVGWVLLRKQEI